MPRANRWSCERCDTDFDELWECEEHEEACTGGGPQPPGPDDYVEFGGQRWICDGRVLLAESLGVPSAWLGDWSAGRSSVSSAVSFYSDVPDGPPPVRVDLEKVTSFGRKIVPLAVFEDRGQHIGFLQAHIDLLDGLRLALSPIEGSFRCLRAFDGDTMKAVLLSMRVD